MKLFTFIKNNLTFVLLVLLIAISAFAINNCNRANRIDAEKQAEIERNEKNLKAMNDTIRVIFNKANGQLEYIKRTYEVVNEEQLKKYDAKLANEIARLNKNIADYIKAYGKINLGDTTLDNQVVKYNDSHYGLKWHLLYSDKGFTQDIRGNSKFNIFKERNKNSDTCDITLKIGSDGTKIDTNITTIKLAFGKNKVKKDGKDYWEVFATSPSNKVVFDSLSSVYYIENLPCPPGNPKVRHITLGPYVGVGISAGPYQVGIGAQYNLRWSETWDWFKGLFKKK